MAKSFLSVIIFFCVALGVTGENAKVDSRFKEFRYEWLEIIEKNKKMIPDTATRMCCDIYDCDFFTFRGNELTQSILEVFKKYEFDRTTVCCDLRSRECTYDKHSESTYDWAVVGEEKAEVVIRENKCVISSDAAKQAFFFKCKSPIPPENWNPDCSVFVEKIMLDVQASGESEAMQLSPTNSEIENSDVVATCYVDRVLSVLEIQFNNVLLYKRYLAVFKDSAFLTSVLESFQFIIQSGTLQVTEHFFPQEAENSRCFIEIGRENNMALRCKGNVALEEPNCNGFKEALRNVLGQINTSNEVTTTCFFRRRYSYVNIAFDDGDDFRKFLHFVKVGRTGYLFYGEMAEKIRELLKIGTKSLSIQKVSNDLLILRKGDYEGLENVKKLVADDKKEEGNKTGMESVCCDAKECKWESQKNVHPF